MNDLHPQPSYDEATIRRAVAVCDEVLGSLRDYPERDEAIAQLEREIIDERLNLLGSAATATSAAPVRVVIVDDQKLFRDALHLLLDRIDGLVVVGIAESGRSAIAAATTGDADVVVMDLRMPGLDGVESIRRLVAARPGTRVVATSAASDDGEEARALAAGAEVFIRKDHMTESIGDAILNRAELH